MTCDIGDPPSGTSLSGWRGHGISPTPFGEAPNPIKRRKTLVVCTRINNFLAFKKKGHFGPKNRENRNLERSHNPCIPKCALSGRFRREGRATHTVKLCLIIYDMIIKVEFF